MALLALAMFTVSSTSRSTTVQSLRPGQAHRNVARPVRGTNFDPARPAAFVDCDGGEADYFIAGRFGTSQAKEQLSALRWSGSAARTRMVAARVQIAENTLTVWRMPAPLLDCRSHYDAVYDRLIYGVADDDISPARRITKQPLDEPACLDGDWLSTFQALVAPERKNSPSPQAGASLRPNIGWSGWSTWSSAIMVASLGRGAVGAGFDLIHLRTLAISFRNWLANRADLLSREWGVLGRKAIAPAAAALGWEEYVELIDRATARDSATPVAVGTSDAETSVRSSGWLRHSAASSLYQLGLFLQAAGQELERSRSSLTTPP